MSNLPKVSPVPRWFTFGLAVAVTVIYLLVRAGGPTDAIVWGEKPRSEGMRKDGDTAPDFSLVSTHGNQFGLFENLQRNRVLIFVTASCPYCLELTEELNKVERENLLFICKGNSKAANRFVENTNTLFPVLADSHGNTHAAYGVKGVPTVYVVGEDRRIESSSVGWPSVLHHIQSL